MRIFFIASNIPRKPHDTRAPNVVVNEAIESFAQLGHAVCLQLLMVEPRREWTTDEEANLDRLRTSFGVEILPPLWPESIPKPGLLSRIGEKIGQRDELSAIYPFYRMHSAIDRRVRETRSDILFSLWSEPALAAAARVTRVPKAIYYGNLDYKPALSRLTSPDLFDSHPLGPEDAAGKQRKVENRRAVFFQMLRGYQVIWNVCQADIEVLQENGLAQARYSRNMWPLPAEADYLAIRREKEQLRPLKICASLGGLQGTGNTYALDFIGRELAPLLAEDWGVDGIELHVFGAREPTRRVAESLKHPIIRRRGFVEDIDTELLECPIFLLCTNCGDSIGGHTRFLHAWGLRSCIVAHAGNKLGMPEMEHDQNVLLAADAREFVVWIRRAAENRELRERIGRAGFETFRRLFAPPVVVEGLASEMLQLVAKTTKRPAMQE